MAISTLVPLRRHMESLVPARAKAVDHLLARILVAGIALIKRALGIVTHLLPSSLGDALRRVQFTPDLLERTERSEIDFIAGPVCTSFLPADEIIRTPTRVKAALIACMNIGQITGVGMTRVLPRVLPVVANRNDLHNPGKDPLPEPQPDRFLLSIAIRREFARARGARNGSPPLFLDHVQAVLPAIMRLRIPSDSTRPANSLTWISDAMAKPAVH